MVPTEQKKYGFSINAQIEAIKQWVDKKEYELVLPNGEKFINGWLENTPQNKYWMEKGRYIWPSGQEYNGSFKKNV